MTNQETTTSHDVVSPLPPRYGFWLEVAQATDANGQPVDPGLVIAEIRNDEDLNATGG